VFIKNLKILYFKILYFQEFFFKIKTFSPKIDQKSSKICPQGCPPHPLLTGLLFLKLCISKTYKTQTFFPKIDQKSSKVCSRGSPPHPLHTRLRPFHPPGLGAICLFAAPLLDGLDSVLSWETKYKNE